MINIGENLRKIRQEHKFTQGDVAESLGIERSTYTCYEIGKTEPSIPCLIKIAKMYNVSLSRLIFGNDEPQHGYSFPTVRLAEDDPDPVYYLPKDEKLLIIAYRLLSEESKKFIIEKTREIAKSEEQQ